MSATTHMTPEAARRRQARRANLARENKRVRSLTTPEGAALKLRIATGAERAGAFAIDFTIQFLTLLLGFWLIGLVAQSLGWNGWAIAGALAGLFYFAVRNFYFIAFEIGRKAATPGKRALGLRVAARNGGRLTANAVLARNFIREIEVFLPLQFLLMTAFSDTADVSGWIAIAGLLWSGVFLFLPLFNRDKLRAGDMIAGTWVIHAPRAKLLADISSTRPAGDAANAFAFTSSQVEVYGIHELHVLEDVLRQSTPEIKASVAERIRAKIGWKPEPGETDLAFLEAYYAALRGRLEHRLLMGERKADKFS